MRLPCPPPRSVDGRTGRPRGLCQALQYGEHDVGVGPERTGRGGGVVRPAAMFSAMARRLTSSLVIAVGPCSRSSPCFPSMHATEVPLPAAVHLLVRSLFPSACGELRASSTRAAGVMAAAAVCLGHGRGARSLVLPACGSARLPPALALGGRARRTPPRLHLALLVKQVRERRWFDPDIRVTTDTFGGEGQDIAVHVAHEGACGHFQGVWMAALVHEDHEHGTQEAGTTVFDAVTFLRVPLLGRQQVGFLQQGIEPAIRQVLG